MNDKDFETKLKRNAEILKKSLQIPDGTIEMLKKESRTMKKSKKTMLRNVGISAAGLAAAFVIFANCVPDFVYASKDIPLLGRVVEVITFNRFEVKEQGYEAEVAVPQIKGLLNEELQARLNKEFEENANAVIAAFEKDIEELQKEYGDDFRLGVEADYMVRTDNDDILAIDNYIVNTVASSSTKHSFYNIDKKTGELLEFEKLFKEDSDYITPISEYIIGEMRKTDGYWIGDEGNFDGFTKIAGNQNFFINDSGNIVVCFDKYEVAIGALGSPEFEIPNEIVKDILK